VVVSDPITVDRRVSASGLIRVAAQRIYVGKVHAGKTVTVHARPGFLRIRARPKPRHPRAGHKQVARFKVRANDRGPRAYLFQQNLGSFVNHHLETKRNT
jgi:hypothetical protein